ncbi:sodium channel protein Nach-like [Culicoides brevitarsis]|uniref:sodium channel protein Nach-like n=1 Tax=Culicoides brevitarsis TaxID=469753 RepID=UPI00307C7D26
MPLVAAGSASINQPLKKHKLLWKAVKVTFMEFAEKASVHGVQYITDPKGNKCTKITWSIIVICFFVFANVLVSVFWQRYTSNPTRVNVDTNHAPLSLLYFPAVTICNIARMSYERASYVVDTMNLPPNLDKEEMINLLRLTDGFMQKLETVNYTQLELMQNLLQENRYDVFMTMQGLMVPCNDMIVKCRYNGEIVDCARLFERSYTWQGYCCSFNIDTEKRENVVRKATKGGIDGGLSMVIRPLVESKTISRVFTDGIKMYVHENDIYPSEAITEKVLPHQTETFIDIIPEETISSEQIRQIPASTRGCVFSDERPLQYFKEYKRYNCEVEIEMGKTNAACNCLPFYYPDVKDIKTCQFKDIQCLSEKYDEFRNDEQKAENCPNQCNQISYRLTANSVQLENFEYTYDSFYDGLNETHMIVHVYMSSQTFRRFRKDLLSNIILLVSNLGGVYSLFVGMSVLSFCEILYFATIRLYKKYKLVKQNEMFMRQNLKPAATVEHIKVVTPPVQIETIKPFKRPHFSGGGGVLPSTGTTPVMGGFLH